MYRGRVLVIDGDSRLASSLARALEEDRLLVEVRGEARAGFARACEVVPDCIACSAELPDIDGAWVARRIRTESSSVAKTPILFHGDPDARSQALAVGGDVFLAQPVAVDVLVAQVSALIEMSRRLRGDAESPPSSVFATAALRGDLSLFPLASILMMFEMERRGGMIEVVSSSGVRATLLLVEGLFANSTLDGDPKPPLDVLREVLSWRAGRFAVSARETGKHATARASVGALVLEAMRLEDEKTSGSMRAAPAAPPLSERSPASEEPGAGMPAGAPGSSPGGTGAMPPAKAPPVPPRPSLKSAPKR